MQDQKRSNFSKSSAKALGLFIVHISNMTNDYVPPSHSMHKYFTFSTLTKTPPASALLTPPSYIQGIYHTIFYMFKNVGLAGTTVMLPNVQPHLWASLGTLR